MNTHTTPRRGFTLVELLIVVGIIIILIGLTIMGFQTLMEIARKTRTKGKMHEVQGQVLRIGKQGRSAAALIQDRLLGHSLEFRPVQAVVGALQTYWNVDISWMDVSGSATYGRQLTSANVPTIADKYCGQLTIDTTNTAWKASHLSKLPPRVYSRWDPCLTMMFPCCFSAPLGVQDPNSTYYHTPGVVSILQHTSLSPVHAGNSILTQLAEWKYVRIGPNQITRHDDTKEKSACPIVLTRSLYTAWFGSWPWLPETDQRKVIMGNFNNSGRTFLYTKESPIVTAGPFLSKVLDSSQSPPVSLICRQYLCKDATKPRVLVPLFYGVLAATGSLEMRSTIPFSTDPQQYPYPWQNLMFWIWPPGTNSSLTNLEPMYNIEFFTNSNDYLNEHEVMPDKQDPYWNDLFSPAGGKPEWMGSDATSELLFAPYKYYKAWPLYIEVKDVDPVDCSTPLGGTSDQTRINWKDEANYSSTAAILYSYAWEDTDWNRPVSGTQAPIWEMPFGRHALVRRDGSMSKDFQKRPFWKKSSSSAYSLEARGGTVADFTPLKTMEILQLAELLEGGESGKTVYRTERNSEKAFNDAYGNPLIVAAAGFLAPRYDTYWVDREDIEDDAWTASTTYNGTTISPAGSPTLKRGGFCIHLDKVGLKSANNWRPRVEYHQKKTMGMIGAIVYGPALPGSRDFLKKRAEQAYGTSRMSYISIGSMGENRGVFGDDNDIEDKVPDWVGSGRLVWESAIDDKVLRAAWLQVSTRCKMNEFGNEEMSNIINEKGKATDDRTAAVESDKSDGIRCVCLPPVELR